jgi:hypothetical protein
MRVVHLAIDSSPSPKQKPKRLSKAESELQSARRFIEIQEQKSFKAALIEFKDEIKEIRERDPKWMPVKE